MPGEDRQRQDRVRQDDHDLVHVHAHKVHAENAIERRHKQEPHAHLNKATPGAGKHQCRIAQPAAAGTEGRRRGGLSAAQDQQRADHHGQNHDPVKPRPAHPHAKRRATHGAGACEQRQEQRLLQFAEAVAPEGAQRHQVLGDDGNAQRSVGDRRRDAGQQQHRERKQRSSARHHVQKTRRAARQRQQRQKFRGQRVAHGCKKRARLAAGSPG